MNLIRYFTIYGLLVLTLSACEQEKEVASRLTATFSSEPVKVIASEHLRFLEDYLPEIEHQTGFVFEVDYRDELTVVREVVSEAHRYDMAWPMSGSYLTLVDPAQKAPSFFFSPLAIGIHSNLSRYRAWCDNGVSLDALYAAMSEDQLEIAMSRPQPGNTGYLTLLAAEHSGGRPRVKMLAKHHTVVVPEGMDGVHRYVQIAERRTVAMVATEAMLKRAQDASLPICLATITSHANGMATFPVVLQTAELSYARDLLRKFFTENATRQRLKYEGVTIQDITNILRKESTRGTPSEAIESLRTYEASREKSTHTILIADVSAETNIEIIEALRSSLVRLFQTDGNPLSTLNSLRPGENLTYIPFAGSVRKVTTWSYTDDRDAIEKALSGRLYVGMQSASGRALYSAIQRAMNVVYRGLIADPNRPYQVILMSAGPNASGLAKETLGTSWRALQDKAPALAHLPLYAIATTDEAVEPLQEIIELTGGMLFKADVISLPQILDMIRSYD